MWDYKNSLSELFQQINDFSYCLLLKEFINYLKLFRIFLVSREILFHSFLHQNHPHPTSLNYFPQKSSNEISHHSPINPSHYLYLNYSQIINKNLKWNNCLFFELLKCFDPLLNISSSISIGLDLILLFIYHFLLLSINILAFLIFKIFFIFQTKFYWIIYSF
jgi:hypothetical protein